MNKGLLVVLLVLAFSIGCIAATFERKWECDKFGRWRTQWFTYTCSPVPQEAKRADQG